jgi:hypothetical protein
MNHILKGKLKKRNISLLKKDTKAQDAITKRDDSQKVHFSPSVNE